MKLKRKVVGKKKFGPTVDITDPCYNKEFGIRMNSIEIIEGDYTCAVWLNPKNNTVAVIGIYLCDDTPRSSYFKRIGDIGIDSGVAGFFNNKPNYCADGKWFDFCTMLSVPDKNGTKKKCWLTEDGFFADSDWGTECYEVFALENEKGKIIALEIDFSYPH